MYKNIEIKYLNAILYDKPIKHLNEETIIQI